MKVLLVHVTSLDVLGGAELSLRHHVEAAPAGVQVEVVRPDDDVDLRHFNTIILGNLRPVGGLGQKAEYLDAQLWTKRLRGYKGYVIKTERDFHPCAHRDARCMETGPLRKVPCDCRPKIGAAFERLYNMCDAVQFISPLHRQAVNLLIDIRYPVQYEIASPIDFTKFRNLVPFAKRKVAALITGDALRAASDSAIMAADAGYELESLEYLSLPYEQMPALLNQYQAVIVNPVMLHAFGRLAVEALACGCRVLASSRVGAMSWPDPIQASREANARFWAMVMNRPTAPHPLRHKAAFVGRFW